MEYGSFQICLLFDGANIRIISGKHSEKAPKVQFFLRFGINIAPSISPQCFYNCVQYSLNCTNLNSEIFFPSGIILTKRSVVDATQKMP